MAIEFREDLDDTLAEDEFQLQVRIPGTDFEKTYTFHEGIAAFEVKALFTDGELASLPADMKYELMTNLVKGFLNAGESSFTALYGAAQMGLLK